MAEENETKLAMFKLPKRRKPIAVGMLRTAPFVAAGVLSVVLYYSQAGFTFDWNRDSIIGLIFTLLSITVYFAVSQQLPYSKKNIIDDILLASLYPLGPKYRINIMELRTSERNAFESFFKITFFHGYNDPSRYKEKINLKIPGASTAWEEKRAVYTKDDLRSDIDSDVKHLWSAAIKDRRGDALAVINIDNIADETISEDEKNKILKSIDQIADLIGYYWEIPA